MIRFGVQLWLEEFDLEHLKEAWSEIEGMGFDSAWLYDHFYPMSRMTSWSMLEPWTVLPLLAAETERVRLGILVTCNSYRYPSILAKMAATVDVVSRGRVEFAIGAGWHDAEYNAYGIPFPNARTRIGQLAEAVEIIKAIWTQKKVDFKGQYYTVKDLVAEPKPAQKPHPPIWIGGKDDRVLRIAAKHADSVNLASLPLEVFERKLKVLRACCKEVGGNYDDIEKSWHSFVIIADSQRDARKMALRFKEWSNIGHVRADTPEEFLETIIWGTPEQCVDRIQRFVDLGVTYFIPHFLYATDLRPLRVFMDKVAPEFKRT